MLQALNNKNGDFEDRCSVLEALAAAIFRVPPCSRYRRRLEKIEGHGPAKVAEVLASRQLPPQGVQRH